MNIQDVAVKSFIAALCILFFIQYIEKDILGLIYHGIMLLIIIVLYFSNQEEILSSQKEILKQLKKLKKGGKK